MLAVTPALHDPEGQPEGSGTFSTYRHLLLGAFPWYVADPVSCTQPWLLWVPLLLPTLMNKPFTSSVLQDSGNIFSGASGVEVKGAGWQGGFVWFPTMCCWLWKLEWKTSVEINPHTHTHRNWCCLAGIQSDRSKNCWRLPGVRCIMCSAEAEQWS